MFLILSRKEDNCSFVINILGKNWLIFLTCLGLKILILVPNLGEKREKPYARFLIKPKVIDRFCWFSIANTGLPMATSDPNLNKIGQKLRPWECRIRKFKMAADDVIKLRYRKSEKNDTDPCPGDYLCEISSKSAPPFRLQSCHRKTDRQTDRHTDRQHRSILTYLVILNDLILKATRCHRVWNLITRRVNCNQRNDGQSDAKPRQTRQTYRLTTDWQTHQHKHWWPKLYTCINLNACRHYRHFDKTLFSPRSTCRPIAKRSGKSSKTEVRAHKHTSYLLHHGRVKPKLHTSSIRLNLYTLPDCLDCHPSLGFYRMAWIWMARILALTVQFQD